MNRPAANSRPRKLKGSVIVITGAGSGLGRALAERFAREGACLILAGRSERTLRDTAASCKGTAPEAITVSVDAGNEDSMRRLATVAVRRFGRIDTWINNAAVAAYGKFTDVPSRVFEGVLRTNLFGYTNGMRQALQVFERQGEGVVINNLSVVGKVGVPYFSSYAVSKAAVYMLADSVRPEYNGTNIKICNVVLPTIDTGVYQRSANYSGKAVRPFPPIYDPYRVAAEIVQCAKYPRREVNIGPVNYLMRFGYTVTPALYEQLTPLLMSLGAFQPQQPATSTEGNVLSPRPDHVGVRGGWKRPGAPAQSLSSLIIDAMNQLLRPGTTSSPRSRPSGQPQAKPA